MDKRRITNGEDPFLDELDHMESQIADLNKVRGYMRTCREHLECYLVMCVQLLWQPALLLASTAATICSLSSNSSHARCPAATN